MIPEEFVNLLRCPITHAPLRPAEDDLIAQLNEAISQERIVTHAGQTVGRPIDEALVGENGVWLYPVYDDVPTLMSDAAVPPEQLKS